MVLLWLEVGLNFFLFYRGLAKVFSCILWYLYCSGLEGSSCLFQNFVSQIDPTHNLAMEISSVHMWHSLIYIIFLFHCLCVHVCRHMYVYRYVCIFLCMCIGVCVCVCVFVDFNGELGQGLLCGAFHVDSSWVDSSIEGIWLNEEWLCGSHSRGILYVLCSWSYLRMTRGS